MTEHDLAQEAKNWASWIEAACAAVSIDSALVDVTRIHDLSRVIAREVLRPMAPVSTFILGVALGANPDADPNELAERIANVPPSPSE